ncbi:MAG: DUF421 domain-containing protein [Siphonobacter sp.]
MAIRFFGKKELAQLSVVDLVFILLISNAVQNAMIGPDTSLQGGLAAALALFITNYILKFFLRKYSGINRFIQGEPLMLIYHGHINDKNIQRSQLSMDELEAAIREHGVENIKDVDLAILEVDGNISVMSQDFKKKTVKKRRIHRIERL